MATTSECEQPTEFASGKGSRCHNIVTFQEPPSAQELDSAIAVFSNPSYTYTIPTVTVGDLRAQRAGAPLRAAKAPRRSTKAAKDLAAPIQARGFNIRVVEKADRGALVALLFNGKQRCQLTLRAAGQSRERAIDIMTCVRNEFVDGSIDDGALHERNIALVRAHFDRQDDAGKASPAASQADSSSSSSSDDDVERTKTTDRSFADSHDSDN